MAGAFAWSERNGRGYISSGTETPPPALAAESTRPIVRGRRFAISSTHDLATLAGQRVYAKGGNAVDAGVAAGIVLTVVEPHMCNFGGVAPIMIMREGMAAPELIDGLGRWPAGITLQDYLHMFDGDMPIGVERSVVPAAPAAWLTALARHGRLTLAEVLEPAIELAKEGFPVDPGLSAFVNHFADRLRRWPASAACFLPEGRPIAAGDCLVQPELAGLFETLAQTEREALRRGDSRQEAIYQACDEFYSGTTAEKLTGFLAAQNWPLTMEDMRSYKVSIESAPSVNYRGYDVHMSGPWSQGPMVGIMLNLLEGFELSNIDPQSADFFHLCSEVVKLAAADRDGYFGDPDFVDVPLAGLLSKAYADERRNLIRMDQAFPEMPLPGNPWRHEGRDGKAGHIPRAGKGVGTPDTSYVCTVDAEGNAFSATPSDHVCGGPLVPGLGIVVSQRGAQLWLDGAHPAAMQPRKRPRLTPNPALVLYQGRPVFAFGSPGEDMQTQAMVQALCHRLDHGMNWQRAIEAPRIGSLSFPWSYHPHMYRPGQMVVESSIPAVTATELTRRGHGLRSLPPLSYGVGAVCAVESSGEGLLGAADPRRSCLALAW